MVKFKLKDQALQKKLDEICGGDFSRSLYIEEYEEIEVGEKEEPAIVVVFGSINNGMNKKYSATFKLDELDEYEIEEEDFRHYLG